MYVRAGDLKVGDVVYGLTIKSTKSLPANNEDPELVEIFFEKDPNGMRWVRCAADEVFPIFRPC